MGEVTKWQNETAIPAYYVTFEDEILKKRGEECAKTCLAHIVREGRIHVVEEMLIHGASQEDEISINLKNIQT